MGWVKSLMVTASAVLVGIGIAWLAGGQSLRLWGVPLTVVCALIAFFAQWIAFVPSAIAKTEQYYDLWGAATYIGTVAVAATFAAPLSHRDWLVGALVVVWALRLGTFLYGRVRAHGGDSRFDAIKVSGPRFFLAWSLQGLWISMTLLATLLCLSAPTSEDLGIVDVMGLGVWGLGFSVEVCADRQKRAFRRSGSSSDFIRSGLWAWSRHPNYFGEILLWIGIAIIASQSLTGWSWLGLLSPLFVFCLLRFGSGIPILEAQADRRFGHLLAYQNYKATTPLLVPRPPR